MMSTTSANRETRPLVAEQWLIASDDTARLFALRADLNKSPSQLSGWRMKRGLVSLMRTAALSDAIAKALASGSASVHVHADMSESQLDQVSQAAVKPQDEHRVVCKSWPDGVVAESLLGELNQPDAWVELGWLYGGRNVVPPLGAPLGDSDSVREHEQAFGQWAQAQLAVLDADDLAELDAHYGPDLPFDVDDLANQPAGDTSDWRELDLPLMLEGEMVAPPAGQAQAAAAAGRPDPKQWQLKLRWQSLAADRPGLRQQRGFEAVLLAQTSAYSPTIPAALKLELRLEPDAWRGVLGIQVWLYPHLQQPILLGLGDADDVVPTSDRLVLQTPVPFQPGLFEALQGTRIAVSIAAEKPR